MSGFCYICVLNVELSLLRLCTEGDCGLCGCPACYVSDFPDWQSRGCFSKPSSLPSSPHPAPAHPPHPCCYTEVTQGPDIRLPDVPKFAGNFRQPTLLPSSSSSGKGSPQPSRLPPFALSPSFREMTVPPPSLLPCGWRGCWAVSRGQGWKEDLVG